MSIRVLSEQLQKVAQSELNEIPNQVQENIQALKEWLLKQPHINYKEDNQLLLSFLRGSKFSLQRTKQKLDAYYAFRSLAPDVAQNLDPYLPTVQYFLEKGICMPLPIVKEDPAGPRVVIVRYPDYDPDKIPFTDMVKCANIMSNILLNECDNYVVSGMKIVWDMRGAQLKTALQATPDILSKLAYCYEKAFPVRIKTSYIVNIPKFFKLPLNTFKMLLSKKLADRVHLYSSDNWEAIYSEIPKSVMPDEYGGTAGPIKEITDQWKKTVESHRERLLNENNYYTDELMRPKGSTSISEYFGVHGSFRKLEID